MPGTKRQRQPANSVSAKGEGTISEAKREQGKAGKVEKAGVGGGVGGGVGVVAPMITARDLHGVAVEELRAAVEAGDVDAARTLLQQPGVDVDAYVADGATLTYIAAAHGHAAMVELLVDEGGADVRKATPDDNKALLIEAGDVTHYTVDHSARHSAPDGGACALYTAARNGRTATVQALVARRADVNQVKVDGATPLIGAVIGGLTKDGDTVLTKAAVYNRVEIVQELIRAGAVLDLQDTGGDTALIKAAVYNRLEIAQELIRAGAALNLQDTVARPPRVGHDGVWVPRRLGGDTALIKAAVYNRLEITQELIRARAALDLQNKDGETALIKAAEYNRLEITQELIRAGAALDLQDTAAWVQRVSRRVGGDTALIKAAGYTYLEIAQELIRAGADLDLQDTNGTTALMRAAQNNSIEIAQELIRAGAALDVQNKDGMTALLWATAKNRLEIVQELIRARAALDLQNKDGYTALIKAAKGQRQNDYISIALIKAAEKNRVEIVQELIRAGAARDLQTTLDEYGWMELGGQTALEIARKEAAEIARELELSRRASLRRGASLRDLKWEVGIEARSAGYTEIATLLKEAEEAQTYKVGDNILGKILYSCPTLIPKGGLTSIVWDPNRLPCPGRIVRVNADDTYDVDYNDGNKEKRVPTSRLAAVSKAKAPPPPPPPPPPQPPPPEDKGLSVFPFSDPESFRLCIPVGFFSTKEGFPLSPFPGSPWADFELDGKVCTASRTNAAGCWPSRSNPTNYYLNTATRKGQYDKPDDLKTEAEKAIKKCPWIEFTNAADQRKYWHNSDTNATVWDKPTEYTEHQEAAVKSKTHETTWKLGLLRAREGESERARERERGRKRKRARRIENERTVLKVGDRVRKITGGQGAGELGVVTDCPRGTVKIRVTTDTGTALIAQQAGNFERAIGAAFTAHAQELLSRIRKQQWLLCGGSRSLCMEDCCVCEQGCDEVRRRWAHKEKTIAIMAMRSPKREQGKAGKVEKAGVGGGVGGGDAYSNEGGERGGVGAHSVDYSGSNNSDTDSATFSSDDEDEEGGSGGDGGGDGDGDGDGVVETLGWFYDSDSGEMVSSRGASERKSNTPHMNIERLLRRELWGAYLTDDEITGFNERRQSRGAKAGGRDWLRRQIEGMEAVAQARKVESDADRIVDEARARRTRDDRARRERENRPSEARTTSRHRCSRCPYVCESAYLLVCHEQRVHVAPDDPDNAAPPGEGWSRAASGDWIWSTGTGTPATQPPPRPPPQKDTAAQVMLNRQQKHQDDALQASMARAQEFNNALNMEESAAAEMAAMEGPPEEDRRGMWEGIVGGDREVTMASDEARARLLQWRRSMIGRPIRVQWTVGGSYDGRVTEFNEDTGRHKVVYTDGGVKWHDLNKMRWSEVSKEKLKPRQVQRGEPLPWPSRPSRDWAIKWFRENRRQRGSGGGVARRLPWEEARFEEGGVLRATVPKMGFTGLATAAASESVDEEKTGPDNMMPGMKRQHQPANQGKEEMSTGEEMKKKKKKKNTKKRLEQWVRDSDDPKLGAKGELPDGLSFARGGASSNIYKSLMKRFRRSQGECRETRASAYGKGAYGPNRGQREERRKQFEIWVRDNTDEGFGAKGELPDGLSFEKGGSTTATYKRLNQQYRRVLGLRNKDVTAEELEERHSAEGLKYAEQALECETQVARAVSELTDSDLCRELTARGLSCGFSRPQFCVQLEAAVSAAAAAAAAAEEGGDAFTYRAFYAGYVDPHRKRTRRGAGNGWSVISSCYICELECDIDDDHGALVCDMCDEAHHLACDVDPSSAKVAEECNLMLAEDRGTGGWDPRLGFAYWRQREGLAAAREVELRAGIADFRQNGIRTGDFWMVDLWRPSLESMSCDLAKNETWLCSSCQQKQAASNTGLCYSRSNIQF